MQKLVQEEGKHVDLTLSGFSKQINSEFNNINKRHADYHELVRVTNEAQSQTFYESLVKAETTLKSTILKLETELKWEVAQLDKEVRVYADKQARDINSSLTKL